MPSPSLSAAGTGTAGTGAGAGGSKRSYAGRTVAERRAERRERFRTAGLELFGTLGFSSVTVTALCAEAGLSRRQFYEEYSGREELLTEIYDEIQNRARTTVVEAVLALDSPTPREAARAAVDAYIEAIATDPRAIRCSFIEVGGVSAAVEAHRLAGRVTWAKFIADTISLVPGTTGRDVDYAATAFIGALTSVVHRWGTSDPRPDRSEIADLLSDILIRIAID
ncbi:TetR/AcrR family transcriptional regulator [Gordonia neofelifaecis]|uniref:TetR family transcriptional regulator n=1 Tax=Gordonia neofelifaecis NRRL B-59395 TaxID=644548 RepID=F1YMI5_9ACTN|nr:TetR/AcrR family transcriptional regulator [Gordonia neofelifaecis]EGD54110.1 TetR family transcriptional regulator [Gordonia neofelifaecis NRRL B-59395]